MFAALFGLLALKNPRVLNVYRPLRGLLVANTLFAAVEYQAASLRSHTSRVTRPPTSLRLLLVVASLGMFPHEHLRLPGNRQSIA